MNNAGIRRDGMMFMMPEQDWHDVLDITLNGNKAWIIRKCTGVFDIGHP